MIPVGADPLIEQLEEHLAEWFRIQRTVPGIELHDESDAVWLVQNAHSWGNAGTMLRFTPKTVGPRLTQILRAYRDSERGVGGFWVTSAATPANIESELKARGLTCRKRFPVMHFQLAGNRQPPAVPTGIALMQLHDSALFRTHGHPYWGKISTHIRRTAMDRLDLLIKPAAARVHSFVATEKGEPVGAATVFMGKTMASVWDVGVAERARRRGIGAAVVAYACSEARKLGARSAMLISTGEGEGMYKKVGFVEAARFAFWYANLRSGAAARRAMLTTLLQTR